MHLCEIIASFIEPITMLIQNMAVVFAEIKTTGAPCGIGLLVLIIYVCYKRSKNPIGGWLLFYIIQTVLSSFVILLSILITLDDYRPSGWADQDYYMLYMLTELPEYFLFILRLFLILFMIRQKKSWNVILLVRQILFLEIFFITAGIVFNVMFWTDTRGIVLGTYSGAWVLFWLLYFSFSVRIKSVYRDHDWNDRFGPYKRLSHGRRIAKTKRCRHCYRKIDIDDAFCQFCGKTQEGAGTPENLPPGRESPDGFNETPDSENHGPSDGEGM